MSDLGKTHEVNTEVRSVTYSMLKDIYPFIARGKKSLFLRGVHGVGKSSVVEEMARERAKELGRTFIEFAEVDPTSILMKEQPEDYELPLGKVWWNPEEHFVYYDIRISQRDFVDFIGSVQTVGENSNQVTRFVPVEWVKLFSHPDAAGFIFFDEADRGTVLVRQAVFEAVNDRRINGNKFAENVNLIAAGNSGVGLDEIYDSTPVDAALASRFITYNFTPTVKEWLSWARSKNRPGYDLVADFIELHGQILDYPSDAQKEADEILPTRRGWGDTARILDEMIESEVRIEDGENVYYEVDKLNWNSCRVITAGLVGVSVSTEFVNWCQNERNLTFSDIIEERYIPGRKVRPQEASNIFKDALKNVDKLVTKKGKSYEANENAMRLVRFLEDVYEENREVATLCSKEMMQSFNKSKGDASKMIKSLFEKGRKGAPDGIFHHIMSAASINTASYRKDNPYVPIYSDWAKSRREANDKAEALRQEKIAAKSEE